MTLREQGGHFLVDGRKEPIPICNNCHLVLEGRRAFGKDKKGNQIMLTVKPFFPTCPRCGFDVTKLVEFEWQTRNEVESIGTEDKSDPRD